MPQIDLVLVHAPAVYDFRERSIMFGPVSDMVPSTPIFEMYPLGFTTMAEYLERHGLRVRIVNLAVLMLTKKDFDVEAYLRNLDARMFGIDLHWLPHAHGSVEVAKILKRLHPDKPVAFGGLSSSYFHEELCSYDCVDFVMRGDSTEEPMRRLVSAVKANSASFGDIPNLTWKDSTGRVNVNELSYVPRDMNAISLDYSFNMKAVIRYRDMMGFVPFKDWLKYPVCASLTCRGCTHDCVTCGGSAYSFREHFGRDRVAFRDPDLLVRDIAHIQKYIPGPIFVLNDFLQAGRDYTRDFVKGLQGIKLKNPIGFEFFKPTNEDFYEFLGAHLDDWSIEISVESHDDGVRAKFGKHHYTMEQVEQSIKDALKHGCSRFDLYFMTGIPGQTAESVRETAEYIRGLYERIPDKRLLAFISPMAPFLDPGSRAFDNPHEHGYTLRAKTLQEHRERLIMPSWKHIMNYESASMSPDEMVDATYDAGLVFNEVKAGLGIIDQATAKATELRVAEARDTMRRIDAIMEGPIATRDMQLWALKEEGERLSQSTVCEKTELSWPHKATVRHVTAAADLWVRENVANLFARGRGEMSPAVSDQHPPVKLPLYDAPEG